MYPKYEAAYIRAFDRMMEYRDKKERTRSKQWADGKAIMDWWVGRISREALINQSYRQLNLFEDEADEQLRNTQN